jgi:histidine ammonia-lyase
MQEDHVSMGWHAARKLRRSIDGLTRVVAIEVLTAANSLDLRARSAPALRPAAATGEIVRRLRTAVREPGPDRYLAPQIEAAVELTRSGAVVAAAETATGPLA